MAPEDRHVFEHAALKLLADILTTETLILHRIQESMSALTDLQAAVAQVTSDVQALIASAAPGSISDAAGEAVVASLNTLDAAVKAAIPAPPAPPAAS